MSESDEIGKSSRLGMAANMINSIIGAGILGLPYALNATGFGAGIILFVLCAAMSVLGYIYLVEAGIKRNILNYDTLFKDLYGNLGLYHYSFILCLCTIGISTAYILLVGDSIATLLNLAYGRDTDFHDRIRVIFSVLVCGILCKNCKYLYISASICLLLYLLSLIQSPFLLYFCPTHVSSTFAPGEYAQLCLH